MQSMFAISMPLHPFVAAVIRAQFPADALTKFATAEGGHAAPAHEQDVIDRFLAGLSADRLELIAPHSSLVASNLVAYLLDFATPDGVEPYLDDATTFVPANRTEWDAMTPTQRLAFFEGARDVGARAREAWAELTRNDE